MKNLISLVILSQLNLHNLRRLLFHLTIEPPTPLTNCLSVFDYFVGMVLEGLKWAESSLENTTHWIPTACNQKLSLSFSDIDLERPTFLLTSEAYSEPCQTSKMECFAKIVKYFRKNVPSSIFDKVPNKPLNVIIKNFEVTFILIWNVGTFLDWQNGHLNQSRNYFLM